MIPYIQRVSPRLRRATVLGVAVILTGFAALSQRPSRQVVTVSTPQRTDVFHLAPDSPQADALRKRLARQAIGHRVRKPDEYYRAAWRLQAAKYYWKRSQQQLDSDLSDPKPGPAILQASYQGGREHVDGYAEDAAHWRERYIVAEREFESIAARLSTSRRVPTTHPQASFGPVVAAASTPGEALGLILMALAAGWGYYRAARPRPAAILLQTSRKVIVKNEWLISDRRGQQRVLKHIDQAAWACVVLALLVWCC